MVQVPSSLSIREVSQRSGCSASALRYYEQEGLIAALSRLETASRRYDPRVLDTLEIISALRGAGFGISDIRDFLSVKRPDESAEQRLARARAGIEKLQGELALRYATLKKAEDLLGKWLQEIEQAQQDADNP